METPNPQIIEHLNLFWLSILFILTANITVTIVSNIHDNEWY